MMFCTSQRVSGWFLLLAVLSLLSIVIGCDKPNPVVVLDDWWDVDYAKNVCAAAISWNQENAKLVADAGCDSVTACPEMTPRVEACKVDPVGNLNAFEMELETQFAANPLCKGIQFARFAGPGENNSTVSQATQNEHWFLSLNYVPGAHRQPWAMIKSLAVTTGEGDAKEIAESVCSIATERGAKLLN